MNGLDPDPDTLWDYFWRWVWFLILAPLLMLGALLFVVGFGLEATLMPILNRFKGKK